MRPMAGMIAAAFERLEPRQFWNLRRGQATRRHDAELGGDAITAIGANRPLPEGFVVMSFGDARAELYVAPQIESVCDMVDIGEDFRLCGVALAPPPFLLQFLGKRIGIVHALDVAARAGIAVPVPGSANAAARF